MAINFPDAPSVNDTYTVGNVTWIWNGTTWTSASGIPAVPESLHPFLTMGA